MKINPLVTLSLVLFSCIPGISHFAYAESADTLFQQAYNSETLERDSTKAIDLYKKALAEPSTDELRAKGHLRLGVNYEKLSRSSEALTSYQDVVDMRGSAPAGIVQQASESIQRLRSGNNDRFSQFQYADIPTTLGFKNRWEFSLNIGQSNPKAGDVHYDGSSDISGTLLYQSTKWLAAGIESGYSKHNITDMDITGKREVLRITGLLRIGPWIKTSFGGIKPYLSLGGGAYNVKDTASYSYTYYDYSYYGYYSYTYQLTAQEQSLHGGFNTGTGILIRFGDYFAIGPDFRYHYVLIEHDPFKYLTFQGRLAFLF